MKVQVYPDSSFSAGVWVHIEGAVTPHFDSTGHVTGMDEKGTFVSDIKQYLHKAQEYNILVFFCLWNGATKQNPHYRLDGLIKVRNPLFRRHCLPF